MKRFFSAAAYMVADGQPAELVSLMIQAPDIATAHSALVSELADVYPDHRPQMTELRELSMKMENAIAAKVCANIAELQVPATVRNAVFGGQAAE